MVIESRFPIALSVCLGSVSRQRDKYSLIEQWLAADEQSPSEAVQQAEELLKVAEAVYQLPEAERVAVIGYYWQRGTLADISEELGRSVPAVAGLVHRGLRRLRGQLVEVH